MAEIPTKIIANCTTGEKTIVPLTAEEIAEREEMAKAWEIQIAEREAQAQAKAEAKASALAKLAALGLTEEEAASIVL